MKLTIIVVNYRNWKETCDFLDGIKYQLTDDTRLLIVENGSINESFEKISSKISKESFTGVDIIRSEINLGFGGACNLGLKLATTKWTLMLNPDIRLEKDFIKNLTLLKPDPNKFYGFNTIDADNNKVYFWGGYWVNRYLLNIKKTQKGFSPDYVNGSAFMVTGDVRFSEKYFLYWEDAELSSRLLREGRELEVLPLNVYDRGSTTIGKGFMAYYYYHRNSLIYFIDDTGQVQFIYALFLKSVTFVTYLLRGRWTEIRALIIAVFDYVKNVDGKKNSIIH